MIKFGVKKIRQLTIWNGGSNKFSPTKLTGRDSSQFSCEEISLVVVVVFRLPFSVQSRQDRLFPDSVSILIVPRLVVVQWFVLVVCSCVARRACGLAVVGLRMLSFVFVTVDCTLASHRLLSHPGHGSCLRGVGFGVGSTGADHGCVPNVTCLAGAFVMAATRQSHLVCHVKLASLPP